MKPREKITQWAVGALAAVLTFGIWAFVLVLHRAPEAANTQVVEEAPVCPPRNMNSHERRDCERLGLTPSIAPSGDVGRPSSR
jgi:hypothetical protein